MFKKISKGDKDKQHMSLLEKQMYVLRILKSHPDGISKGFLWKEARAKLLLYEWLLVANDCSFETLNRRMEELKVCT